MTSDELNNLFRDPYYIDASLDECVDLENFTILAEIADLSNIYPIVKDGRAWYWFTDKNNIVHAIRLTKGIKDRWEIRLWFHDPETNKPKYDKPNVYNNLEYDAKIYNTHLKIFIEMLIPYFFSAIPNGVLYCPFIDKPRYRLFRISLGRLLDKDTYVMDTSEEAKNILKISLKSNAVLLATEPYLSR